MPSSVSEGSRPRMPSRRWYSSGVSPCSATTWGVMAAFVSCMRAGGLGCNSDGMPLIAARASGVPSALCRVGAAAAGMCINAVRIGAGHGQAGRTGLYGTRRTAISRHGPRTGTRHVTTTTMGTVTGRATCMPRNESRVAWAALLTGGFMLVEAVGGLLSGSLALLADAGHMLTDAASLTPGVAGVPRRPPSRRLAAHLRVPSLPGAGRLQQRPDAGLHRPGDRLRGRRSACTSRPRCWPVPCWSSP